MTMFRKSLFLLLLTTALSAPVTAAADGQLRPASDDATLKQWLQNMVWQHRYTPQEIQQVTGLDSEALAGKLRLFNISPTNRPARSQDRLLVLPYPGGRHPRIGFLDGAVEPQRETKLSVFCPWDDHSYVVMDVPEAIWSNLGLTYLAHSHIPTIWDADGTRLEQLEWTLSEEGEFRLERRLPNGIEFGTTAMPHSDHVELHMWIRNGTDQRLSDLRVQNCVMLKGAEGFDQQTNDNKQFVDGYAVAGSKDKSRWIITAWDPVHRTWGNAPCPCLHSDPKFPDCDPDTTQHLRGWLSFYSGTDLKSELARIEATGWRTAETQSKPDRKQ